MTARPITIVGGGLAGLTLGIGLRQQGIAVRVWEAGHYPRHRVCGEFLNGRGLDVLDQLGLRDLFLRAGARPAESAAFFSVHRRFPIRRLPQQALCLPRDVMDHVLAEHFHNLGGELKTDTRWAQNVLGEGVVCASGRRLQPVDHHWRWFGLKAHATNVELTADLEMHVLRNGYVGLCCLNNSRVNVCGLFRRRKNEGGHAPNWQELLRGPDPSLLRNRLGNAVFDRESFCSVAGLCLRPQRTASGTDCRLGDALTMIPPITGNGMSMAIEAAQMAVQPIAAFARCENSWTETHHTIARCCDEAFGRRLKWASFLQWLMFAPLLQTALGAGLMRSDWLWHVMFTRTR